MSHFWTRVVVSIVCLALAIAHHVWPRLTVDATTLALFILAVLPWLASVLKSIELPGGLKIELQDIKAATDKVVSAADTEPNTPPHAASGTPTTLPTTPDNHDTDIVAGLSSADPNIALVGVRIEIERRLAHLAEQAGLPRRSAGVMLRNLTARDLLDRRTASGLQDLIALGNQAAHGADVSPSAARWALDVTPSILAYLDNLISKV